MTNYKFKIKYSLYATILLFIMSVLGLALGFAIGYLDSAKSEYAKPGYILLIIFILVSGLIGVVSAYGFIHIGKKINNKLLYNVGWFYLVLGVISLIPSLISFIFHYLGGQTPLGSIVDMVISAVFMALTSIPLGVALFKAKKDTIYKITGGLYVLTGLMALTVILYLLAALMAFPTLLANILLFYKEDQKECQP